jgi:prophage regulatory protein
MNQGVASKLPETGYIRLPEVLAVYPLSKSTWWAGIRDDRYPAGVKLSERTTAWRVEDIRKLIESVSEVR